MGNLFGLVNCKIFFGVLEIPGNFWGLTVVLGPSLRMKKK